MVSSISYLLGQNKRVVGFGRKRVAGKGIGRTLAAKSIKFVGNKIVDAIARSVEGGSYKLSGVGLKKARKTMTRKPRKSNVLRKPKLTLKRRR